MNEMKNTNLNLNNNNLCNKWTLLVTLRQSVECLVHNILYGMMNSVLSIFHESTLGDTRVSFHVLYSSTTMVMINIEMVIRAMMNIEMVIRVMMDIEMVIRVMLNIEMVTRLI